MTLEQIELEFAHIKLDRQESGQGTQAYYDDGYDEYDSETDEYDSKISDTAINNKLDPYSGFMVKDQNNKEEDWEDVEIDDY